MARQKRKRSSKRGLGSASELLVFIENDPDLSRGKQFVQHRLVTKACRGGLRRSDAEIDFLPITRSAQKRLRASAAEGEHAATALARDFVREVNDCRTSPFCNLPAAAERELKSSRCRR